ncbi:hypothetical protein C8R44DRAFT_751504 [Mycena epipterygia]|nr:hypothetical protein C8R44DRAFT_751504 [Mycena epipterygia]
MARGATRRRAVNERNDSAVISRRNSGGYRARATEPTVTDSTAVSEAHAEEVAITDGEQPRVVCRRNYAHSGRRIIAGGRRRARASARTNEAADRIGLALPSPPLLSAHPGIAGYTYAQAHTQQLPLALGASFAVGVNSGLAGIFAHTRTNNGPWSRVQSASIAHSREVVRVHARNTNGGPRVMRMRARCQSVLSGGGGREWPTTPRRDELINKSGSVARHLIRCATNPAITDAIAILPVAWAGGDSNDEGRKGADENLWLNRS